MSIGLQTHNSNLSSLCFQADSLTPISTAHYHHSQSFKAGTKSWVALNTRQFHILPDLFYYCLIWYYPCQWHPKNLNTHSLPVLLHHAKCVQILKNCPFVMSQRSPIPYRGQWQPAKTALRPLKAPHGLVLTNPSQTNMWELQPSLCFSKCKAQKQALAREVVNKRLTASFLWRNVQFLGSETCLRL